MLLIGLHACSREWLHLKGLKFRHLRPWPIVDLLIGLAIGCAELHYSFKRFKLEQPIAIFDKLKTCLTYQTANP